MIAAEKVHELCARPEGTKLDFKSKDYDWNDPDANAELAKDIMAMSNSLARGSEPSYILIGVDEKGGGIVGITPGAHRDDAELHQRIKDVFNRPPVFAYAPVEVDGLSVGVYEIRPGYRPYYPRKDHQPRKGGSEKVRYRANVAKYRDGSSTFDATPDQIIEWAREDDEDRHEVVAMERRKMKADGVVRGKLLCTSRSWGDEMLKMDFELVNQGRSDIIVRSWRARVEWNDAFYANYKQHNLALPAGYTARTWDLPLPRTGDIVVREGEKEEFKFRWSRTDGIEYLQSAEAPVAGFNFRWATYHFEAECESIYTGDRATLATAVTGGA